MTFAFDIVLSLNTFPASDWDACACSDYSTQSCNPFITHRFLYALEKSLSIGGNSGWLPHYMVVRKGEQVVAVLPLYVKLHSQGEYIFDHMWANAYMRAGGDYYPKAQIAVPFTPVTGVRFGCKLAYRDAVLPVLLPYLKEWAESQGLSSVHVTFCTEQDAISGVQHGFLLRHSQQFHWPNKGYADFDAFLAILTARKRKAIKKERAALAGFDGSLHTLRGDDIKPMHWDAFWRFYQNTGQRKYGMPYLTRGFFDAVHTTMRDDVVLMMAKRNGRWIAGALHFVDQNRLFGRYWGCLEYHPYMHFELCYYRAIDYAIRYKLDWVEAGAQGGHKLPRGYVPVPIYSLHWFVNRNLHNAVARYLREETPYIKQEQAILQKYALPYR